MSLYFNLDVGWDSSLHTSPLLSYNDADPPDIFWQLTV